ncbi:recombinase RecT [Leifsonia sp. P73]|uniref:recombinase RecT n=1 Tax=Leifsonia sp. P73 TaxID=3423959 RepID=UPI003DA34D0B
MSGEITQLPGNGDVTAWSDAEKAIVEAAGLVFTHTYGDRAGQREPAPRPIVEKFLSLARRSGLDPLAGQIYCIGRLSGGRVEWSVQTGIDGFRLVAERSGKYAGQDPAEWMTANGEWVDAFIPTLHGPHPLAARVKVYRSDWPRPSVGVAEWGAYAQTKKNGELNAMWEKQGPGQLAKCAEALAHRKAFAQDLSGLYTVDEFDARQPEPVAQAESGRDWLAEIDEATTHAEVEGVVDAAKDYGELNDTVRTAALTRHGILSREENTEDAVIVGEDESEGIIAFVRDAAATAASGHEAARGEVDPEPSEMGVAFQRADRERAER